MSESGDKQAGLESKPEVTADEIRNTHTQTGKPWGGSGFTDLSILKWSQGHTPGNRRRRSTVVVSLPSPLCPSLSFPCPLPFLPPSPSFSIPSSSLSSFLFFLLLPYPPPSSSPLYLFQACCLTVLYIYSRTLSLPVTLSVPLPPHRLLSPFMSFGLVL